MKVLPEIEIKEASAPVTVYFLSLQYVFEYINPPIAIFVFDLVGVATQSCFFLAVKRGGMGFVESLSKERVTFLSREAYYPEAYKYF